MTRDKHSTTDVIKIIDRWHFSSKKAQKELKRAQESALLARQVRALRIQAKPSQRELGRLVGTTASVICRLEDDDYAGHSLSMLRRIAAVLDTGVGQPYQRPRRAAASASRVHAHSFQCRLREYSTWVGYLPQHGSHRIHPPPSQLPPGKRLAPSTGLWHALCYG